MGVELEKVTAERNDLKEKAVSNEEITAGLKKALNKLERVNENLQAEVLLNQRNHIKREKLTGKDIKVEEEEEYGEKMANYMKTEDSLISIQMKQERVELKDEICALENNEPEAKKPRLELEVKKSSLDVAAANKRNNCTFAHSTTKERSTARREEQECRNWPMCTWLFELQVQAQELASGWRS